MRGFTALVTAAVILIVCLAGCAESKDKDDTKEKNTESSATTVVTTAKKEYFTAENIEAVTKAVTEPTTEKRNHSEEFIGKWAAEKYIIDDTIYEGDYEGIPLDVLYQLEIKRDGTAVVGEEIPEEYFGEPDRMKWTVKDETIELTSEDGRIPLNGKIIGGKLVITDPNDDAAIHCVRVQKFAELDVEKLINEPETTTYNSSDYAGKWACIAYDAGGESYEGDMFGVPLSVFIQTEFYSNGTGVFRVNYSDDDTDETEFEWTQDYFITEYDDIYDLYFDKNSLVIEGYDELYIFERVNEFKTFDWEKYYNDLFLDLDDYF